MSDGNWHQLPSSIVADGLGEVNVRVTPLGVEVHFTILMEPQGEEAEGWQTGVALDASQSMKGWYGRNLMGKVPDELAAEYQRQGWVKFEERDGRRQQVFQRAAYEDALRRGVLKMTPNIVTPAAREFISYLASKLDADGGTTVIYWACGDGAALEEVGDKTAEECRGFDFVGPQRQAFGSGTRIVPAIHYFVERFQDALRGMYVVLTDGRLDDLQACKDYTTALARQIAAGQRHPVKFVLVGVGDDIDERQMEELDDLDTGTEVDIWDHKIAKEMRDVREILAEVVSEHQLVAPAAEIRDLAGTTIKRYTDGLPGRIKDLVLPVGAQGFDLVVGDAVVRQRLA